MAERSAPGSRLLTVPNVLSAARLACVPVFVWLFATGRTDAAVVLFGVAALSDFVDGFVARRTGAVTDLGKLLDPLADRVLIVALCLALVARDTLPAWLAAAVVARDLLVLSLWPLLERRGVPRLPVNIVGKAGTALLLVGLVWLALTETAFGWAPETRGPGLATVVAGGILYWAAAALYGREAAGRWRSVTVREPLE